MEHKVCGRRIIIMATCHIGHRRLVGELQLRTVIKARDRGLIVRDIGSRDETIKREYCRCDGLIEH